MKASHFIISATLCISCMSYAAPAEDVDTSSLTFVDENHVNLTINKVAYTLDSFIVPFEQPYYVRVKRDDSKPLTLEQAVAIAEEYIQPRGCTEPLVRREDLDKFNSNKSQWIIGIAC